MDPEKINKNVECCQFNDFGDDIMDDNSDAMITSTAFWYHSFPQIITVYRVLSLIDEVHYVSNYRVLSRTVSNYRIVSLIVVVYYVSNYRVLSRIISNYRIVSVSLNNEVHYVSNYRILSRIISYYLILSHNIAFYNVKVMSNSL